MGTSRIAVLLLVAASAARLAAAPAFPYAAEIAGAAAYVRSGPGINYYPTDRLEPGERVEVYRHAPGGWCAVRPPEGSFSWVEARSLRIGRDGLATVEADQLPAYVGSRFSRLRDMVQVRLDRGELVDVLGEREVVPGSAANYWYRIAPPAGEFRWIHRDDLVLAPTSPLGGRPAGRELPGPIELASGEDAGRIEPLPPDPGSPGPQAEALSATEQPPSSGTVAEVQPPAAEVPPGGAASEEPQQQALPGQAEIDAGSGTAASESADIGDPAAEQAGAGQDFSQGHLGSMSSEPPPAIALPLSETDPVGASALEDIDLELSMTIAAGIDRWQLGPLRRRAEQVLETSTSVAVRGRARALLSRIVRFEDIYARHQSLVSVVAGTTPSTSGTARAAENESKAGLGSTPPRIAPLVDDRSPFDGQGRLTPVVSQNEGAPQFALLNAAGEVVCFVTSAPGTNLRPYVGKQVGIIGIRGYMPELKTRHVVAKRVTVLEPTRLR